MDHTIQHAWQHLSSTALRLREEQAYPTQDNLRDRTDVLVQLTMEQAQPDALASLLVIPDRTWLKLVATGEHAQWECYDDEDDVGDPDMLLEVWEHDATVTLPLYSLESNGDNVNAADIRHQLAALLALDDAALLKRVHVGCDTDDSRIAGE